MIINVMEKMEFINVLKELTEKEDTVMNGREVNELRSKFEDYILEETRLYQIAELEAKDNNETFTEEDWITPLKESFYEIFTPYKIKRKEIRDAKIKVQEENLKEKRILISQLKDLIANEEKIGVAFNAHKEINEKWKKIGDIPRKIRHEIQQDYSRLLEEFFYNMHIYKEIKEYDFKKNYDLKKAIIKRLQALSKIDKIKEIEVGIKRLQNEWEDIGPTKQELWEEIKKEYWSAVNAVYERIQAFYEKKREERRENITKKKEVILKVKDVLSKERDEVKAWNNQTKEVLSLQDEWKSIGFGPKKENEEVWKEFRSLCDEFFSQKGEFFKGAQEEFDGIAQAKKQLIEKANALKESTDWEGTKKTIITLQKQWKNAGNAGQKNEQKLWKEFRAACDGFFDARTAHFAEQDKAFDDNLKQKEEFIKQIDAFKLPKEKDEALNKLKEFSEQFANIGFVPRDKKIAIFNDYKTAINKHYESLDLKGGEKEKVMFEARINTLKGSGNSGELLSKEKETIRAAINTVKQQIMQFENNLGFFKHSKGPNPLKEQAESNLVVEQEKLDALIAKLKMIPNE